MMAEGPRRGFIGFGEAAWRFAKDLSAAGLTGIAGYSRSAVKAPRGDPAHARATEAGVERMTQSTLAMPREIIRMGLRERFGAREPDTIAPVLDAIVESRRAKRD